MKTKAKQTFSIVAGHLFEPTTFPCMVSLQYF